MAKREVLQYSVNVFFYGETPGAWANSIESANSGIPQGLG